MSNDKETKSKLLLSARKEFMEKGYNKASLRNICKNAGVTTGALYFFFKDKEDLFAAIVEEPLNKLHGLMMQHYNGEKEDLENLGEYENFENDDEAALSTIHFMYKYYDEFQLLLTKSQGSRFENCIDDFVEISEKLYKMFADMVSEKTGSSKIDDYMIHLVVHMQIDAFVHLLTHEESEEAAVEHMKYIVKFLTSGWFGMFNKIR